MTERLDKQGVPQGKEVEMNQRGRLNIVLRSVELMKTSKRFMLGIWDKRIYKDGQVTRRTKGINLQRIHKGSETVGVVDIGGSWLEEAEGMLPPTRCSSQWEATLFPLRLSKKGTFNFNIFWKKLLGIQVFTLEKRKKYTKNIYDFTQRKNYCLG